MLSNGLALGCHISVGSLGMAIARKLQLDKKLSFSTHFHGRLLYYSYLLHWSFHAMYYYWNGRIQAALRSPSVSQIYTGVQLVAF